MSKRQAPTGNIEWTKIPADARVEDLRTCYVAVFAKPRKLPGVARATRRALIYWGSSDAARAQHWLAARARRG